MRIIIEVPDVTCRRCGATALLKPQFARPRTERSAYSPAHVATDNYGVEWDVTAERPEGWAQILNDPTQVLCPVCAAGLNQAVADYLRVPAAAAPEPRGSTIPQLAVPVPVTRSSIPVVVSSAPPPSSIPISAAPPPVVSTQRVHQAAAAPAPIPARAGEPGRASGALPGVVTVLPTAPIPRAAGK